MANKTHAYKEWLGVLFSLLTLARRQGLAVLETSLETPADTSPLFHPLPAGLRGPYVEFLSDLVRMLGFGNLNDGDADRYVTIALQSYAEQDGMDERLLRMIALATHHFIKGYPPDVACEFARQSLPLKQRPTWAALKAWLDARQPEKAGAVNFAPDVFKDDIDRFMASIGKE